MRTSFGKEKKKFNGTQMREEQSNMSKTYKMRTSFGKEKKNSNRTQMREEQSNMSKTYKMRTSFGKEKKTFKPDPDAWRTEQYEQNL